MGDIGRTDLAGGRVLWSLSRLASEFCMARETVSKRLAQADVQPAGMRNGHEVYHLLDAAPAILHLPMAEPVSDPMQLPPTERRAWFQSENERLKAAEKMGALVPAETHRSEMATICKTTSQVLEALPDLIERDCGIPPSAVVRMREIIETFRQTLFDRVLAAEASPPSA
jgi:hypothetical protein